MLTSLPKVSASLMIKNRGVTGTTPLLTLLSVASALLSDSSLESVVPLSQIFNQETANEFQPFD
ncbi:MAG TPA: hypothetical protein DCE56_03215 [Cyanobacteria bacterium UBA8553]|nr:hypothetical protein [Cyanobacteria bacterium UBA8553]